MAKKSGVGLGIFSSPNLNKDINQVFTHGRVKFAITNSTTYPDSFKKFGEWATIGAIFFEDINNPQSNPNSSANTIAYPLNPNSSNIPLTNEIVYIVKLPNSQIQGNVNSFSYYYFNPLNIWNSAHHNAIPDGIYADTIPESQQQDYIQTEAFSKEEWETSLLLRFDYLIKKMISACVKESTENFNEDTIQDTWFHVLDAIFKIKSQ